MLDLKIINGLIVDGTGGKPFAGSVGVREGRIVEIGVVEEDARETIDATGQVVSPGFIDVHTHYDAQAFWDPTFSPSCYHGVTTVFGGFCGFSIAPLSPDAGPYLQRMLARVEGMPLATLEKAVPWDWTSFGEFLDKIDGRVGLNAGFFCGHSAIRRVTMGSRAVGGKATEADLAEMKRLLDASLTEGALGFSTSVSLTHNDAEGNPVPSRSADREEIMELAKVVASHEGTSLEMLPDVEFGPAAADLIIDFSLAGQRAVNWNLLSVNSATEQNIERAERQLAVGSLARERGAEVVALTIPYAPGVFVNLYGGVLFEALPGLWQHIFQAPVEMRIAAFKDPDFRRRLAIDADSIDKTQQFAVMADFANYVFSEIKSDKFKKYQGRLIGDVAKEESREVIDVMLEVAVEDGLHTIFTPYLGGEDLESYQYRANLWRDDRALVGGSDAGAHMDMIDTFAFSTSLIAKGVRVHGVISLEDAVHQMTEVPANFMGLVDRGALTVGHHADIAVFDPETIARGETYSRRDVPGGELRLYADAIGVNHVVVNGMPIVRNGVHTGALPGTVLRSGRDTKTVPLQPALLAAE